jgi:RimJ/RimL family protein N-acetyltransferase
MMNPAVFLRNVERDDLSRIYEFQLDPESNRMAVTIPRSADGFSAHWQKILTDPNVTAKAILIGDEIAGCISCFRMDGLDSVGYWLGREFWGRGIASRALELLMEEVSIRPLHARVATSNAASLRVLQKCGFVVEQVQLSPADNRYPECEEALLILREATPSLNR